MINIYIKKKLNGSVKDATAMKSENTEIKDTKSKRLMYDGY